MIKILCAYVVRICFFKDSNQKVSCPSGYINLLKYKKITRAVGIFNILVLVLYRCARLE